MLFGKDNEPMVRRIYVEKKKQFADEAASLLSDIRSLWKLKRFLMM